MSKSNNVNLKGPNLLAYHEDNWQTNIGAIVLGQGATLRGRDVLTDFENTSWMEYLVFAVTGINSPKIARLLDAIWTICTSYPDPRLWNNRVAALAGTTRSTGALGVAAGVAVSEATLYGLRPIKGATDILYRFKDKLERGEVLDDLVKTELKKYRAVYGFGRPLASGDERVKPLMKYAKSINADSGPYINLAFEIDKFFKSSRYRYQINIAAVAAGLAADAGLTADQFYHFTTLCFTGGMFPCFIDAMNHPAGTLFPLSSARINYVGTHFDKQWG